MPDYREAFVGIGVAKLKMRLLSLNPAETARYAIGARLRRLMPPCAVRSSGLRQSLSTCISVMRRAPLATGFDVNISTVARRWSVNRGLLKVWRRAAGLLDDPSKPAHSRLCSCR